MTNSESAGGDGTVTKRRDRFNSWRRGRPFAGGALLVIAALVIAWIPINIASDTILIGKALSPIGLMFAALVFLCGIFALTRPELANIFGVFGVLFSMLSLYGALGGFLIGTFLGIFGGVLCYAWREEDENEGKSGGEATERDFESTDETATEDSDDRPFGTRSRVRRAASAAGGGAGGRTPSIALLLVSVIVLSAFAHPLVAVAARDFPEQQSIDGTIVVAEEFSGSGFNHENVTTDTSNRESVSAGKFSFESDVNIEGLTMYKNFRGGPTGPSHLTIKGSSASAPKGLSFTASEAYFGRLGIGKDPVVIPAARQKWSTCPGQDFLFSVGDLGPLPGPPIDSSKVVTNTHRLSTPSISIEDFKLTMQSGTKSTSVSGTPECTKNPVEPILDLFTANALALLTDNGVISPNVTTLNGTANTSAPAKLNRTAGTNASGNAITATANATATTGGASTAESQTTLNAGDASAVTASTQAAASQTPTGQNTTGGSNANGGTGTTMAGTRGTNGTSTTPRASATVTTGNSNGGATNANSSGATTQTGKPVAAQSVPKTSKRGPSTSTSGKTTTVTKTQTTTASPTPTPVVSSSMSDLSGPDEVKQGKDFTVTANVTNTGNKKGLTLPVTYGSSSGDNQTKKITLDPNQTKTIRFTDTVPGNMSGGNYAYNVSTNTSSKTGSLTVPPFNTNTTVSHLSGPDKKVKQAGNFTVAATVKNTGNKYGLTLPVTYGSPSGDNQTETVTLDPGQIKTIRFTDTVPGNMSGGNYAYNVSTNTSSKTGSLTVPPFNTNTTVSTVSSDIDEVAPGGSFDVTATVKNIGNKYDLTLPVTYEAGDGVKKSREVTLDPGQTKTVTFSDITVPDDKSGGSYKYTVSTNESSVTKSISVAKTPTPTATTAAAATETSTTTENGSSATTSGIGTTIQSLFAGVF